MDRFSFFIHVKRQTSLQFAALIFVSVFLLILPRDLKSGISAFIFKVTYGPFYAIGNHIRELEGVREENRRLHQKVMELSLRNSWLNEEHLENRRLHELLGFKSELEHRVIPADVMATEPNRRRFTVLIDKGLKDGVRRNMSVVNMNGLVGKILDASSRTAVVQLLIEPSFRASAVIQRSRVFGIVKPESGFTLRLNNVPLQEDVQEGDRVITSGLGGIFPPGIDIGMVTSVQSEEAFSQDFQTFGIFKMIQVMSSVDFSTLEELFVLEVVGKEWGE
jgi:rod shape-determining protein MreC